MEKSIKFKSELSNDYEYHEFNAHSLIRDTMTLISRIEIVSNEFVTPSLKNFLNCLDRYFKEQAYENDDRMSKIIFEFKKEESK